MPVRPPCPSATPIAIIVLLPFRMKEPRRMRVWDDARPIYRGNVHEECTQVCKLATHTPHTSSPPSRAQLMRTYVRQVSRRARACSSARCHHSQQIRSSVVVSASPSNPTPSRKSRTPSATSSRVHPRPPQPVSMCKQGNIRWQPANPPAPYRQLYPKREPSGFPHRSCGRYVNVRMLHRGSAELDRAAAQAVRMVLHGNR